MITRQNFSNEKMTKTLASDRNPKNKDLSPRLPTSVNSIISWWCFIIPNQEGCHKWSWLFSLLPTFDGWSVTFNNVGWLSTTMKSTSLGWNPSAYTWNWKIYIFEMFSLH